MIVKIILERIGETVLYDILQLVLKDLTELFFLVIASFIWMAAKEPFELAVLAIVTLLTGGAFWFLMRRLRNDLPPPRKTGDSLLAVLSALALIFTLVGASCSYAIGNAGEALDEAFAQFTRESYERAAGAWHGTTFVAAAHRVAALGPEYAVASDEAMHGGLTLPLDDQKAARVVAEVYADQALERMRSDGRIGYAVLRRWLPVNSSADLDSIKMPGGKTVLTADPGAHSFVGEAIEASLAVARLAVSWEIADYIEIKQFKLWLPAISLWTLTFLLTCATAVRRIEQQSLSLAYRR